MRHATPSWLVAVLVSTSALASPEYANVIQEKTGSSINSGQICIVCHDTTLGGNGTVNRAFGRELVKRGLTGESNVDGLGELLDELRDQNVDTDGDGTPDFDELSLGRNPNKPGPNDCFPGITVCSEGGSPDDTDGGVRLQLPPVTFGCSAGAGGGALVGLVLSGATLVVARRRRR
ncbi:MAG: thrombospondin type 3 repeat-containing protein [Myxococcaceae bacterium]|nr:thrombospondin type 3 repeat-containing protein [Myxococcaceae bacterium]